MDYSADNYILTKRDYYLSVCIVINFKRTQAMASLFRKKKNENVCVFFFLWPLFCLDK